MSALRVLLVNGDAAESRGISSALSVAQHAVVPASGLEEAAEALLVQRFDAVLLGSALPEAEIAEFTVNLRQIEKIYQAAARTPVLSIATDVPGDSKQTAIDAYLSARVDAAEFVRTFEALAQAVTSSEGTNGGAKRPEVFDVGEFRIQVAFDPELMVEIIDLFLAERAQETVEMAEALEKADLEQLSRIAHTIKGSLGSLHADCARLRAQELESAARDGDREACAGFLGALEEELDRLEPLLLALREAPESE